MGPLKIVSLNKPFTGLGLDSSYEQEKSEKVFSVEKNKEKNLKGLTKLFLSIGYFGALVFSLVKLLT
jgi:hypothetical protein